LIHPLVEEFFWRGYLGAAAQGVHASNFLCASFHAQILMAAYRMSG
jgi:hypothetical protein